MIEPANVKSKKIEPEIMIEPLNVVSDSLNNSTAKKKKKKKKKKATEDNEIIDDFGSSKKKLK